MAEYQYGIHCGDADCYACATQRYNCTALTKLDAGCDVGGPSHPNVEK